MKTIGVLGGMSWESTLTYYRILNQETARRLGGFHSAELILHSVQFADMEQCIRTGDWARAASILCDAARKIEAAGADLLILATNTFHQVAPEIEAAVKIPFLHLVDVTAREARRAGISTVGLLGTRATMELPFYRERLEARGLNVILPSAAERGVVHRIIFEELVKGRLEPGSRSEYRRIMHALAAAGAQGVVLGCTEISLLVDETDSPVPLLDTTALHARAAVEAALAP